MNIDDLIEQLQKHREKYGNAKVKVRSHQTRKTHNLDYVSYWTKTEEVQLGIEGDQIENVEKIARRK